jgi:hypothetical protein
MTIEGLTAQLFGIQTQNGSSRKLSRTLHFELRFFAMLLRSVAPAVNDQRARAIAAACDGRGCEDRRTSKRYLIHVAGVLFVIQADDACAIVAAAITDGQPVLFVAAVAPESAIYQTGLATGSYDALVSHNQRRTRAT